jgi:hypothetical protein
MASFKQGRYIPKHPEKYKGDITNICFRSSWEQKCMIYFDMQPSVLEWSSEEVVIPYYWEGKLHRYYPDFYIKVKNRDGEIVKYILEIKPIKDTVVKQPKRMTEKAKQQYIDNILVVSRNNAKWEAASNFCKNNGMIFKVLTEKELFGTK